jgi:uncharacterized membrane protein
MSTNISVSDNPQKLTPMKIKETTYQNLKRRCIIRFDCILISLFFVAVLLSSMRKTFYFVIHCRATIFKE